MIVHRLSELHRSDIHAHFEGLSREDLWRRFCSAVTLEFVHRYVDRLNVEEDVMLGAYDGGVLVGFCHLARPADGAAEIGISMLSGYRGRGVGAKMIRRAKIYARVLGAKSIYISTLSSNTPMIALAKKSGVTLRVSGEEMEARVPLGSPDLMQLSEAVCDEQTGIALDAIGVMLEPVRSAGRLWECIAGAVGDKEAVSG